VSKSGEITALLRLVRNGDISAEERLIDVVYPDLRRIAHRCMRNEKSRTISATELLHDAWVDVMRGGPVDWRDRVHFFAILSTAMRRILVEYARSRNAAKRGGGRTRIELAEGLAVDKSKLDDVILVDEALNRLSTFDQRMARIVEMRYFGGLTEDEVAAILDISARTVKRDWKMAKGFLAEFTGNGDAAGSDV
jgi:RNA polymerase sigma factor (TIGR02999 family)